LNDKQFKLDTQFEKQRDNLIKKGVFTLKQVEDTLRLYKRDKHSPNLYGHKIVCKKDKKRYSIAVQGTNQEYKILLSEQDRVYFVFIGHHKKYDRLIKRC